MLWALGRQTGTKRDCVLMVSGLYPERLGRNFNMADKSTYYEILGVTQDSSLKEVK